MNRQAWLAERRTGIGGSDAAAIVGLNEWESPYSVWADKMGYLPEKEDTESMRQGRDLEDYVAKRFCETSGKKVRRVHKMFRHPMHRFMIANIDRDVIGERTGLECKTTSVMSLKKFRDGEFPVHYYCQCVHYMTVLEYDRWYLAVLVLNAGFKIYMVTRIENDPVPDWCESSVYVDQEEVSALIEKEQAFWRYVTEGTPPPVDGMDATRRALEQVNPFDESAAPVPLFGYEHLIRELQILKTEKKRLDSEIQARNNQLMEALKGAPKGLLHGYEVRLSEIRKTPYTVNPKPYTTLRIKEVQT